jgi:5'-3' exonuclease
LKRLSDIANKNLLSSGIIVAWDDGIPEFRMKLNPSYKGNRASVRSSQSRFLSESSKETHLTITESDFLKEYQKLVDVLHKEVLPNCKCISSRVLNTEADDIIAFCCYYLKGFQKMIVSSDKDLLQLIDETTSVYNFNSPNENSNVYDYEWVLNTYYDDSIFREHFLTEKAILGDISDNIKGIEFVGQATAKKYADQIIDNRRNKMSVRESLTNVTRPDRASKKGYDNFINGVETILKNVDLMDLHFPIKTKNDMVYNIQKSLVSQINLPFEYYTNMGNLEESEDFEFNKCYTSLNSICQSNCSYDMSEVLETLKNVK